MGCSLVNHAPRRKETKTHIWLDTDCALFMETTLLMVPFVWLRYTGSNQQTLKTHKSLSVSHGTVTPCCPIASDMGTGAVKSVSSTQFCPL